MSPKLEILTGDLQGKSYAVDDEEFVIGRSTQCHIVIPKRYISREHARISRDGRDYIIDGLSEKNPVRVANRPIREHLLSDGDVFEFCGIQFRFRVPAKVGGRGRAQPAQDSWQDDPAEDSWQSDGDPAEDSWQSDDAAEDSWRDDPSPGPKATRSAASTMPRSGDSWRDAEDEDSWAPAPKRSGSARSKRSGSARSKRSGSARSKRAAADAASDSWRVEEDEDSWGAPKQQNWNDEESEDSFEQPRVSRSRNKGSVVFGDEDDDEAEGTGEIDAQELVDLSVRGSGSGANHGESSNERTAELDKANVGDLDDPDYDPFAEVEASKKKTREVDPAREKTIKLLMAVAFVGIVLAGVVYHKATKKDPWQLIPPGPNPIVVAPGQTVKFVEPWSKVNPPQGVGYTSLSGEPNVIHKDPVAEVEWAVPHVKGQAILLVQGLEEGTTQFTIRFPKSRKIKTFEILVEGDDGHETARDKRKAEMRQKSIRELQKIMKRAEETGKTLTKHREFPSKESYYRQALQQYELANDAAQALRLKGGARHEKEVRAAEDAEGKAREDWETFVDRELANYRDAVSKGESTSDRKFQLKRVLRAINHVCDPRYMRLKLILNKSYDETLDSDGSEDCPHYGIR